MPVENHLETVCFDLEGFLAKAHSIGLAGETESLSAILRSCRSGEQKFREQIELAEAQLERNLTDVYSIHRNTGIETEHFQECLDQMGQIMYRLK